MTKKKSGLTLLELITALGLISIIVLAAGNILIYSANIGNRHVYTQEIVENGRISLDFLVNQTRIAHSYRLFPPDASGSLTRLDLRTNRPGGPHTYVFRFNKNLQRLDFGGINDLSAIPGTNELASGIRDVIVTIDDARQMMYFTVISGENGEFKVSGGVDIRYMRPF